jgi:hypothetical protein
MGISARSDFVSKAQVAAICIALALVGAIVMGLL